MLQRQSPSFMLAPAFVARVANLPITQLSALRFTQSYRLLQRSLRLEDLLARRGEALSVELHDAIGALSGPEYKHVRQRLISLRRAIFQVKAPASRDMSAELLALLPPALAARVRRWLLGLQQLQNLRSRLTMVLEEETASKHTLLLEGIVKSEGGFLAGLLLGSKDLYLDWRRWLARPMQPDRKLVDGLMNYLARMASKTSPYSAFTSLARGQWVTDQAAPLAYRCAASWDYACVVEANYLLIRQIASALTNLPQVRARLILSANPTLCMSAEGYQFVAHTSQGEEALLKLKPTSILQHILRLTQTVGITYGAVLDQLCTMDKQGRTAAITRFLDQLIEQGLLQLAFPIADQSPNYLAELLAFLRELPEPYTPDIISLLTRLSEQLDTYARTAWDGDALADQRYKILADIQQIFAALFARLLPESQLPAKNLLYETTLLPNLDLRCSRATFPDLTTDLGLVQQLTGLYDPHLPGRLALAACFLTHYEPEAQVGLLDFYARFCQERHVPASTSAQPNYAALAQQLFTLPYFIPESALPALGQLVELRRQVILWLRAQPVNEHQERHVERAGLQNLLSDLPAFVQTPLTLAYYCQVIFREEQPWLVLNSVQSGFGRTLARFHYAAGQGNECCHQANGSSQPLPVSIQGVFGSNINLRVDPLPYEIVYPGVVSERPLEEQLPLSDLSVRYHAGTGRLQLFSRRLQSALLPAHMGMMSDYWLPPLYKFLIRAFSEAPIDPLWSLRLIDAQGMEAGRATSGVTRSPRLIVGSTIVDRAHWLVAADAVPRREKQETDQDYWLKVERWRAQHDIPQECFLRVNAFDLTARTTSLKDLAERNQLSKKRKPLPIDFQNYFLLQVFERQAAESPFGFILEEALPASEQHVLTNGNASSYASEYVFELSQEAQS